MLAKYNCLQCGLVFENLAEFKEHLRREHVREKSYQNTTCNICKNTFASRREFLEHNKLLHKKETEEHKCFFCKKTFTSKTGKYIHELKHSGEKPYKCHICSKSFDNPGRKSVHMRMVHFREKMYKCDQCPFQSHIPSRLEKHAMRCDKTYKRQTTICDICDENMESIFLLNNHIWSVHPTVAAGKFFKCAKCGQVLSKKGRYQHETLVCKIRAKGD